MKNSRELKNLVKQKYQQIALNNLKVDQTSCCGTSSCSTEVCSTMSLDYDMEGYYADADLNLGCGLPTQFAKIKKGDTVIDLGSGAGNDCFIARNQTREDGRIIGIDFTPAMIEKANANLQKLGFSNVEFRLGDVENIPVSANMADVIVSNCVLNLVTDKEKAFKEIFRVLKHNGHFSISDIVVIGELPDALKKDAEMYAGCVAGATEKENYLELIKAAGFNNIIIQEEKQINLPDNMLKKYLNTEELKKFKTKKNGIFSITVYAEKPKSCCDTECCN